MKKIIAIITALVLCILLFSGCGQSLNLPKLDPKDPVSLDVWHYYNGVQKIAFDKMVQDFNETVGKEKGIVVEAFNQGNVGDLIDKVIDAANKKVGAGDIPDIFAAYADTAFEVDKLGLVASLDDYLTDTQLAEYREEYLEEGRFDEQENLKIFPIAKSTEIMMLNLTDWEKFSAATGAKLTDLETIEGVTQTAQKYYEWTDSLTDEQNDGKAFFGRDAIANYFVIGSRQLGAEIFEVQGGVCTVHLEKEILRKLWDHYYVPIIKGYYGEFGRFRSDDAKQGDIIALVGSTAGAAYFPDRVTLNSSESYEISCVMLKAPHFENGELYAVQQGAGMVVSKSEPKTEYAATVFLTWFTEAQRNIEFAVASGYLPVKNEANDIEKILPSLETIEDSLIQDRMEKEVDVALQQLSTHKLYATKAFDGGVDARKILDDAMTTIAKQDREKVIARLAQGMTLDEATAEFVSDAYFETWFADLQRALQNAVK